MTKFNLLVFLFLMLIANLSTADERENSSYIKCVESQKIKDTDACIEEVGRIEWYPYKSPESCLGTKAILEMADKNGWKLSWKVLFMNERCHRLGEPFYTRETSH